MTFYKKKRVFITGHTGFKGSWMCKLLSAASAEVMGFALEPPTEPSLFELANIEKDIESIIADIRDLHRLKENMISFNPEIAIHMAAQPIVRDSYKKPVYTYDVNVMGTLNFLEAVRLCPTIKSVVIITTDKVYRNNEWVWGYREDEYLDGYDPYSNSKSCAELVTSCYRKSFFNNINSPAISTMRAGNVIGGGDFAIDRIIPDCIRAVVKGEPIIIRNPHSTRPYQHVIEAIYAYLLLAAFQYVDKRYAGSYNVGPNECDCITTGELVDMFCGVWGSGALWVDKSDDGPHEASFLKLDNSKIMSRLGWKPLWDIETAIKKTVEWSKLWVTGRDLNDCMEGQIVSYLKDVQKDNVICGT